MVSELAEEVVDYEDAEEDPDMPAAPAPREASRRAHTPSQPAVRPACSARRCRMFWRLCFYFGVEEKECGVEQSCRLWAAAAAGPHACHD